MDGPAGVGFGKRLPDDVIALNAQQISAGGSEPNSSIRILDGRANGANIGKSIRRQRAPVQMLQTMAFFGDFAHPYVAVGAGNQGKNVAGQGYFFRDTLSFMPMK